MNVNKCISLTCLCAGITLSGAAWALEVGDPAEVSGVVELEYGISRGDSGHEYAPLATKVEVEAAYKPSDKVDLHTLLLYEDKQISVDEADITWHALPDKQLDVTAGKQYLPFGAFKKGMISNPLTKKLGETQSDKVLLVSNQRGDVRTQGYTFAGTGSQDTGYGMSVEYKTDAARVGVDYVSNLVESKHVVAKFASNAFANAIPAVAVHGLAKLGRVTVIAEHITATQNVQPGDLNNKIKVAAKPATTQLEVDLDLHNDRTLALAWSGSSDAAQLKLVEEKLGVTYSQPLYKDLQGAMELMQSKDYDGTTDKTLTAQLAYAF